MIIKIDFNSNEAIYIQLRNQIIQEIANCNIKEGDSLPSVRQLASLLDINMHTVNKAYNLLKEEGYIKLDRRRGAVISVNQDKERLLFESERMLRILIAKSRCKNITSDDLHALIDRIFDDYKTY